jgi:hypothetical protein
MFMFNRHIIENVCFRQRVPLIVASRIEIIGYSIFNLNCKTLQRKKKQKDFFVYKF